MPNPTGGYTLQFGAFADSVKAYKLIQKLTDIGLEPYISETEVNGAQLLRVRAENFNSRDEAEEAGSALGDQFIYMVVPRE